MATSLGATSGVPGVAGERQLRSWLRHERMTVAAALAKALHRSAPKVGAVPCNAPRSQKTARASEEHPGVLKEPEVQLEGSHGRLRGSSPGGGVAGWRRRRGRHHHQVPPQVRSPQEAEGGGRGEGGKRRRSMRS